MNEVLKKSNDVKVPGHEIESDGVQVGGQVRETNNPPLHADCEYQVDDQLLDYIFLLDKLQVVSFADCDRCRCRAEDPQYNACRLTGTMHSRHLCVVRHNLVSMFCNIGCGGEHDVPTCSRSIGKKEPILASQRLMPP